MTRHRQDNAAGVIVFHRGPQGCRYLLVLSRLTRRPLWEFPKGGIDPGETPLEAALRELREETGLADDAIRLVPEFQRAERYRFAVGTDDARTVIHKHVTYFLARALRRDVVVSAAEIVRHEWVAFDEARRRIRYAERRRILGSAAESAGCDQSEISSRSR